MILAMPIDILFDFAAVHLAGDRAADADIRLDFTFTDLNETWHVWVRNGVLNDRPGAPPKTPSSPSAAPKLRSSVSFSHPPAPTRSHGPAG
jgi:alkyl sulfatase BDS1-like metallo-beta-lactamase superfamily hydrolase